MRNRRLGRKLGKDTKHRKAMFRNMATSLFGHGNIRTTDVKAKELRRYAEKLITIAKQDTLHARRQVAAIIRDKTVLKKLFDEIAPHFKDRPGGYTRIVKLGIRKGDNAPISYIELVPEEYKPKKAKKKTSKKKSTAAAASKPAKKASSKKKAAEDLGLAEGTQAAPEAPEAAEAPEVEAVAEVAEAPEIKAPKAELADSETPSKDEQAPQAKASASKPAKSKKKTSEKPEPQVEAPKAEAQTESEGPPDSPKGEEAESGDKSSDESSTEDKE